MQSMINTPIVFVTYPIGAGGWFLASLLNSTYTNTLTDIKQNARGSGHANMELSKLNNWYTLVQDSTIQDILYQTNNTMLEQDQIEYLRNSVVASPEYGNEITHVISLHCQNLNLFLKAFPNSKSIMIDIVEEDLDKCVFNFIYKVLPLNLKYFESVCNTHNRDYKKYSPFLQNINLEALENLKWITTDIKKTIPCVTIEDEFQDKITNIDYKDYINDADPVHLVLHLNDFLKTNWSNDTIDKIVDEIVLYRLKQPLYPTV